jgi:hypothetical protein
LFLPPLKKPLRPTAQGFFARRREWRSSFEAL